MKKALLGLIALTSLSAGAATQPYLCPAKTFTIYSCKGQPETATAQEVKDFVQDMLVCYSTITKSYSAVVKGPKGDFDTFTKVKSINEGKIEGFTISPSDADDDSVIAALEVDTEASSAETNSKITFLLPGIDMQMNCLRAK